MAKSNWLLIALVALLAYIFLFKREDFGEGGGGGGGGSIMPFTLPTQPVGVYTTFSQQAGTYVAKQPTTNLMEAYTPKTNVLGPLTYIAPPTIQNMISPGPALPAPAPGIGLSPRAIML